MSSLERCSSIEHGFQYLIEKCEQSYFHHEDKIIT